MMKLSTSLTLLNSSNTSISESDPELQNLVELSEHIKFFALVKFYYMPVIIIVGILGNFMIGTVFLLTPLRKKTSSYMLLSRAAADTIFLSNLLVHYTFDNFSTNIRLHLNCITQNYVMKVSSSLSVWYTVGYTVERYIAVLYPTLLRTFRTPTRTWVIIGVIALVFSSLYIYYAIAFTENCSLYPEYENSAQIFVRLDAIINFVVPFLTISIMNILIVKKLIKPNLFNRQSGERSTVLVCQDSQRSSTAANDASKIDATLDTLNKSNIADLNNKLEVPDRRSREKFIPEKIFQNDKKHVEKNKEVNTIVNKSVILIDEVNYKGDNAEAKNTNKEVNKHFNRKENKHFNTEKIKHIQAEENKYFLDGNIKFTKNCLSNVSKEDAEINLAGSSTCQLKIENGDITPENSDILLNYDQSLMKNATTNCKKYNEKKIVTGSKSADSGVPNFSNYIKSFYKTKFIMECKKKAGFVKIHHHNKCLDDSRCKESDKRSFKDRLRKTVSLGSKRKKFRSSEICLELSRMHFSENMPENTDIKTQNFDKTENSGDIRNSATTANFYNNTGTENLEKTDNSGKKLKNSLKKFDQSDCKLKKDLFKTNVSSNRMKECENFKKFNSTLSLQTPDSEQNRENQKFKLDVSKTLNQDDTQNDKITGVNKKFKLEDSTDCTKNLKHLQKQEDYQCDLDESKVLHEELFALRVDNTENDSSLKISVRPEERINVNSAQVSRTYSPLESEFLYRDFHTHHYEFIDCRETDENLIIDLNENNKSASSFESSDFESVSNLSNKSTRRFNNPSKCSNHNIMTSNQSSDKFTYISAEKVFDSHISTGNILNSNVIISQSFEEKIPNLHSSTENVNFHISTENCFCSQTSSLKNSSKDSDNSKISNQHFYENHLRPYKDYFRHQKDVLQDFHIISCKSKTLPSNLNKTPSLNGSLNTAPKSASWIFQTSVNLSPPQIRYSVSKADTPSNADLSQKELLTPDFKRSNWFDPFNKIFRSTESNKNQINNGSLHNASNRRKRTYSSTTFMLVITSSVFLLLHAPSYCLRTYFTLFTEKPEEYLLLLIDIFDNIGYLHYSINFFLYSFTGSTFRAYMKALFKC